MSKRLRFFSTPWFFKCFYPAAVWEVKTQQKFVYLTFDDGPTNEVTPWILETLKVYEAKATFFCVGENLYKHPLIAQKIISENHLLANHSYHHLNGFKNSTQDYLNNIELAQKTIQTILPTATKIMRPPYGRLKLSQYWALKKEGYQVVMWSFLTYDFDININCDEVLNKMSKKIKPGSIIVLHDNYKSFNNLKQLLPNLLAMLFQEGYEFKTVPLA